MKTRKKIVLVLAFVALSLVFWRLYLAHGDVSARASFGYDDEGKFVAFSFDRPVYLRKVQVGDEEFPVKKEVGQSYVLRYNWKSKRDYSFRLEFKRGGVFVHAIAPVVEPRLEIEARFYHAYYGGDKVAVAETRLFSVENDVVRAYFTGAAGLAEEVVILRYPPVLTPHGVYEDFIKELSQELKKLGVRVVVSKKPRDTKGLLVIAGGAWPQQLNHAGSVIYIGASPGEVLVRADGSLTLGRRWENIIPKLGRVSGELNFRKSAYTALNPDEVVVYREDGYPGVFRIGNVLVFSNTLDLGWRNVRGAVEDVVKAVISWGFIPGAEESFRLRGDARNFTFILHAALGNENGRLGLAVVSEKTGKVLVQDALRGEATVKGPLRVYPGEETVFTAYVPGEHESLRVEITGVGGGGAQLETEPTLGVDVRRIRASFNESGKYLVKVKDGGEFLGAALVHVRKIEVEPLRIEAGARGVISIAVMDDGEPYSGVAVLYIDGQEAMKVSVKDGLLRYHGYVPKNPEIFVDIHGKRYLVEVSKEGLLPGWVKPYHIALTVLMVLAALFSFLVRERETRAVTITMPEAAGGKEVYVKATEVIRAFDLYNRRMRWEKLPLSLAEVQRALYLFGVCRGYPSWDSVKKLLDRDMNADIPGTKRRVPDELCVLKAYGLYAPVSWETGGQSIEHLAMIRAAYEWLLRRGVEVKALTASSFTKGYPDLVGVATADVMKAVFGYSSTWDETVLLVECETGLKSEGETVVERLVLALSKKVRALRPPEAGETQEEERGNRTGEKESKSGKGGGGGSVVQKKSNEKGWRYHPWLLKNVVLIFVLSPELYAAYKRLTEKERDSQDLFDEVMAAIREKKAFVVSMKDIIRD